jgi:hypothetical protein|tara:strand:+ start:51374 stop:51535 length:162 start_codon:yes stop_codon:yes gene_type:complete
MKLISDGDNFFGIQNGTPKHSGEKKPAESAGSFNNGGEGGVRTLDEAINPILP